MQIINDCERQVKILEIHKNPFFQEMLRGFKQAWVFYLSASILAAYGIFSLVAFPALRKQPGQLLGCGLLIGTGLGMAFTTWLLPLLVKQHVIDRQSNQA